MASWVALLKNWPLNVSIIHIHTIIRVLSLESMQNPWISNMKLPDYEAVYVATD